jgi:response regulator NasT
MSECRIILGISNTNLLKKLKILIQNNGYVVIDESNNLADCTRKIRAMSPDIVILGSTLGNMSTYQLVNIILSEKLSSVITLGTENTSNNGFYEFANRMDFEFIQSPINTAILINTIYMLYKSRVNFIELQKKIDELEDSLETRKLLDRAKGLLMKGFKIEEKEAHRRIQKTSMDTGKSLKEVAKLVIEKYGV